MKVRSSKQPAKPENCCEKRNVRPNGTAPNPTKPGENMTENITNTVKIIAGLVLLYLLAVGMSYALGVQNVDSDTGQRVEQFEDQPGWDCHTMGNLRCAP